MPYLPRLARFPSVQVLNPPCTRDQNSYQGKLGGPLHGGIFGSFPAMFLSTLVITYLSNGPGFSRAVGKSLLVSGLINIPLYEIAVRWLYPGIGLGIGTVLALLFSAATGYITYQLMKARMA